MSIQKKLKIGLLFLGNSKKNHKNWTLLQNYLQNPNEVELVNLNHAFNVSDNYVDNCTQAYNFLNKGNIDKLIIVDTYSFKVFDFFSKLNDIIVAPIFNKETAALSREHNNANVLILATKQLSKNEFTDSFVRFLGAHFEKGRHLQRINILLNSYSKSLIAKQTSQFSPLKKIVIGCDHTGVELKNKVIDMLHKMNFETIDVGTNKTTSSHYPIYGIAAGKCIEMQQAYKAIVICGSGIGIANSIAKNKYVHCALCSKLKDIKKAYKEIPLNAISLPARFISTENALKIVSRFAKQESLFINDVPTDGLSFDKAKFKEALNTTENWTTEEIPTVLN